MHHKTIITALYAILLALIVSCGPAKQNDAPMILVFNTSYGEGNTVTLPLTGETNVTIDWGDGHVEHITEPGLIHHTYQDAGRFTVRINGSLSHFGTGVNPYPNVEKLRRVESFGNLGLESLSGAFNQASLLVSLPDSLPASVTNLSWLFAGAEQFNLNIENWNTGNVTDMTGMFSGARSFNQPLGNWNVSNVTSMTAMFRNAQQFNQYIGSWETGRVTDMQEMFAGAGSFDQPLGQWDISQVRHMEDMFRGGGLSEENYDNLLTGWTSLPVRINVTFHAGESMYASEAAFSARRNLKERNRWTIFDGHGHHIMALAQNGRVNGQGSYPAGDTITLRAVPDPGYRFARWEGWGTEASEDSLHTIVVDGDLTIRARFALADTSLTAALSDTTPEAYPRQLPADTAEAILKGLEQDIFQMPEEAKHEADPHELPDLQDLDYDKIELWFRMDEPFSDYYFVGGKYHDPGKAADQDAPAKDQDAPAAEQDTLAEDQDAPSDPGLRFFVLNQQNEFLYASPAYPNALSLQADVFRHTNAGFLPSHELDKDSHTPVRTSPLIIVTDASDGDGGIGGHLYLLENNQVRKIGWLNISRFHYSRELEKNHEAIGENLIIEKEGDIYLFRFDTGQVVFRPRQNGEIILDASACHYRYDGETLEFVVEDGKLF